MTFLSSSKTPHNKVKNKYHANISISQQRKNKCIFKFFDTFTKKKRPSRNSRCKNESDEEEELKSQMLHHAPYVMSQISIFKKF